MSNADQIYRGSNVDVDVREGVGDEATFLTG